MKIAISTATYFADAILGLLIDAGYDVNGAYGDTSYILVNTNKHTAWDGNGSGERLVLCPATQWSAIASLVNATNGGSQAPASAPAAQSFSAPGAAVAAAAFAGLQAGIIPADFACNPLAVGDTVLVISPASRKPQFVLRTNGVAVITRITAKGALGFAFDEDNEFLSKRFQKVTVTGVASDEDAFGAFPVSGDLVVARPGRHSRNADNASKFALPTGTALVFRGVTVDKGNFILDEYNDHQYSPSRFSLVTPVGA